MAYSIIPGNAKALGQPRCLSFVGQGSDHSLIHTCFMPSPPASHPALFPTAHFLASWGKTYWLNDLLQGLRPGYTELQQSNIIVKGLTVIVFVDHNPSEWRDELGAPLHIHPKVCSPWSGVRQPGGKGMKHRVSNCWEASTYRAMVSKHRGGRYCQALS